jgi:hypothetical protein
MKHVSRGLGRLAFVGVAALAAVVSGCDRFPILADTESADSPRVTSLEIPVSIRSEHQAIRSALDAATRAAEPVGGAARELDALLQPHFVREEEIALPPLGLIAPLAEDAAVAENVLSEAVAMAEALEAELPRMLDEHVEIRAAVEKLAGVARTEGATDVEELAHELALHARTEEEVLYPAAILVGDQIRLRSRNR